MVSINHQFSKAIVKQTMYEQAQTYEQPYEQKPILIKDPSPISVNMPEKIELHVYVHEVKDKDKQRSLYNMLQILLCIPVLLITIPAAAFVVRVSNMLLKDSTSQSTAPQPAQNLVFPQGTTLQPVIPAPVPTPPDKTN